MNAQAHKLGIVGAGNMSTALITGLISSGQVDPGQITVSDPAVAALVRLSAAGVHTSADNLDAVREQDVVFLVVKPQVAPAVLEQIAGAAADGQLFVSLMAGVRIDAILSRLGDRACVIRVMPQTLVRLAVGVSALCPGPRVTDAQLTTVRSLLDLVGRTVTVSEAQMDAVTGLSGSGPAYAYTVIEALADGGVRAGLSRDVALVLAAQTLLGAATLVLTEGTHPAVLRDQVTSPGGTTIAGLHKLEEHGLRYALISAVQAAAARSAELGA